MRERKKVLFTQLGTVDQEICDIEHYIEFSELNASQGYNTYRMIKERRIRRREIKNEIDLISSVLLNKPEDKLMTVMLRTTRKIDRQTYTPRVMAELFNKNS